MDIPHVHLLRFCLLSTALLLEKVSACFFRFKVQPSAGYLCWDLKLSVVIMVSPSSACRWFTLLGGLGLLRDQLKRVRDIADLDPEHQTLVWVFQSQSLHYVLNTHFWWSNFNALISTLCTPNRPFRFVSLKDVEGRCPSIRHPLRNAGVENHIAVVNPKSWRDAVGNGTSTSKTTPSRNNLLQHWWLQTIQHWPTSHG